VIIDLNESPEKALSSAKSNGIDLLKVKRDNLLICNPTVPRFSLGNKRWGEHIIFLYYILLG
jgi:hypothetical protein